MAETLLEECRSKHHMSPLEEDWVEDYHLTITLSVKDLRDFILPAQKAATPQWLPIETAPKDGTKILVIDKLGVRRVGSWNYGWFDSGSYDGFFISPIRWQPLPEPPK